MADSHHASVHTMLEATRAAGEDTVFARMEAQGDLGTKRCSFCERGIRCSLCSQGPCRITERAPRGVCGIDADGMAMRNFLLQNTMGTATYTYHATEVMKTLREARPGGTYEIKDWNKLETLAAVVGEPVEPRDTLPKRVADAILAELARDHQSPSPFVEKMAPAPRVAKWRELGILPGGVLHENTFATSSCLTNVDGNYVSLALKSLRLGIATAYGAQIPLELAQDALWGTPTPHPIKVDLGIIDPDYVNIAVNGHEPMIGAALIAAAHEPAAQAKAKAAGAKGLRIVGSIETGQELVQRFEVDDVFVGLTGNWLSEELAVATGGLDVFAADMNCTVPTLGATCAAHGTLLVPVSDLVGVEGAEQPIVFEAGKAAAQAQQLIDMAVANFPRRKSLAEQRRELRTGDAVAGFSTDSILGALGGSLDPLLDVIKNGTLKGVCGLVSCTTLRDSDQDDHTVAIARELIKNDVLVLAMGCGNAGLQVAGLEAAEAKELAGPGLKAVCELLDIPPVLSFGTCTDTGRILLLVGAIADALGVDVPALPVVASAPEYMEQKATIDAMAALAFGLYVHVNPVPFVTGAPNLVKLVTQDLPGVTGGKLDVETDAEQAVANMLAWIADKRQALGI
ncbi:MAG TPA: anaerobic carbon-monoxide dehydrogenase catalytic subunit [Thermoleophilia bacterium]|nr:anaerobic carbon-monoxide dehydrogenase catalytic subunit [Thermoleophilia bacterium]HQG55206.1 anaerobic carbon-monoxide dehydrogenase catalytic subunit [Thermoleophilia bacterium]